MALISQIIQKYKPKCKETHQEGANTRLPAECPQLLGWSTVKNSQTQIQTQMQTQMQTQIQTQKQTQIQIKIQMQDEKPTYPQASGCDGLNHQVLVLFIMI